MTLPRERSSYRRRLREMRATNFLLMEDGLEALVAAYRLALRSITRDLSTNVINPERANALRRLVLGVLRELEAASVAAVAGSTGVTVRMVLAAHDEAHAALAARYPDALGRLQFDRLAPLVTAVIASRRGADTFRSLLRYRFAGAEAAVDRLLTASIPRGVASGRVAVDLARLIAGNESAFQPVLAALPKSFGTRLGRTPASLIDWSRYGVGPDEAKAVRTLFGDTRRIAISETNNSFREANAVSLASSPVIRAVAWQLSGRHDAVESSPDECDVLAEADAYGLGPGFFPPELWPQAPHPYCACYQGAVEIRPPGEWKTPRPPPPPSDEKAVLRAAEAYAEKWTPNRLDRASSTVLGLLRDAEAVPVPRGVV